MERAKNGGRTGLAAEPTLKNFDLNIVTLIESEVR